MIGRKPARPVVCESTIKVSETYMNKPRKLSDARQHVLNLTFLFLTAVLFFAPIHFSGKSLIAGDTVQWRGMAQSMIEYEETTGRAALWAGHAFSGMPGYMISPELTVPQVDDIMRWVRGWLWPSSHMFLLFAGTYLLGWYLTRESLAGVLAAVCYGLTTYIPVILMAGHNSKFIALAWLPWLLLAFVHVLRRPGLTAALLFAVAVGVNLRAGHVQITYYAVFGAIIWWVFEMARTWKADGWKPALTVNAWLILGSVLGLAMVAEPYLSHAEFAAYTIRGAASGGGAGGSGWEYAMAWSQGPGELLTLLIADAYGGGGATYWGGKVFTAGPHYFGGVILVLAATALLGSKRHDVRALMVAAFVMTLFALGENFSILNRPMFDWFPLFSSFRVPETWLSVVALFVSLAGAHGLSALKNEARSGGPLWSRLPVRVAAVGLAVVAVLWMFNGALLSYERPNEQGIILSQIQSQYPQVQGNEPQVTAAIDQEMARRQSARMESFSNDARRTAIVLVLFGLALVLYMRRVIPFWAFALTAVLVATIDLASVGRRYINEDVLTQSGSVEDEVPEYAFDTFLVERKAEQGGDGHFRVLSLEFGQDPGNNGRPSFFHESLGGYTGAKLRSYQDFLDHVLFTPGRRGLNERALSMMNVRYLVAERGLPGWTLAFQDDRTGMSVFESPAPSHRAWFVDSVQTVPEPVEIWSALQDKQFNPLTTAITEIDLTHLTGPGGETTAQLDDYVGGQDMTFSLTTDRDRLLVLSEVHYPEGWVATLDDEPVDIVRVSGLLRGIVVPEGTHSLELTFAPASHRQGIWITTTSVGLTYGVLLLLGLAAIRRRRS